MDSIKKLPVDPSVEHLRKQAKRLLADHRLAQPWATQRCSAVLPGKAIKLADAQHVVAVEYGFTSWAKLIGHVESVTADSAAWSADPNDNIPKAATAGDFERVRRLVDEGRFTQHDLDLGLARATHQHLDIAQYLVDHGADVNGEYGGGYGPILLASCEGANLAGIRFLLERGADPDSDPDRRTKYANHNTPMRMLLGSYMRVDPATKHAAIDLLREYGATQPSEVDDLAFAVFRDDADQLAALLDADPSRIAQRLAGFDYGNIKLEGATYLHHAVEHQAVRCVDLLCERGYAHGIEINTRANQTEGPINDRRDFRGGGQTPIFHAIASNGGGNFPMFEHLLERYGRWIDFSMRATIRMYSWRTKRDETFENVTPLEFAKANFDSEDANSWWKTRDRELAILRQRDVRSAMEQAVKRGDLLVASELMDAHRQHVGPHLWAAAVHDARSLALTEALLERGLNPNARADPRSALDMACYIGNPAIIAALVAGGAKVNTTNPLGEFPAELLGRYEPLTEDRLAACRAALGLSTT